MKYRVFSKNGVFEQADETFSNKTLDKFIRKEEKYVKNSIYNEFKESLTTKPISNAKRVDKLTNEKYDELAEKADENIRKNHIMNVENQKEIKLGKFSRNDDER